MKRGAGEGAFQILVLVRLCEGHEGLPDFLDVAGERIAGDVTEHRCQSVDGEPEAGVRVRAGFSGNGERQCRENRDRIEHGDILAPRLRYSIDMELIFEVRDADEGGYCARALGHSIFTQAETWEELRANVLEATSLHFEEGPAFPKLVQLHYVRDELIPVQAA
jgi:hypothetical protein